MKLLNFIECGKVKLGIDCDLGIVDVEKSAKLQNVKVPVCLSEVFRDGTESLEKLIKGPCHCLTQDEITFAPCVTSPEKILCVGLNYLDHSKECNFETATEPVLFGKFNNALCAHGECVALSDNAKQYDYEAELVIVIGKTARNVSEEDAKDYIFGFTAGNDLSARDMQFRSSQWLIGKSFDKSAPIGPHIVTADSIDTSHLEIMCKLNGEIKQHANTELMIFSPEKIVSYASKCMTLRPGDVIFTGTPSGVTLGLDKDSQRWIKSGDVVEVYIEGIGTLETRFK